MNSQALMPVTDRMNGRCGKTRANTSGCGVPHGIPQDTTPTMTPSSLVNTPPESPRHVPIPSRVSVQKVFSWTNSADWPRRARQSPRLIVVACLNGRNCGMPCSPTLGYWKNKWQNIHLTHRSFRLQTNIPISKTLIFYKFILAISSERKLKTFLICCIFTCVRPHPAIQVLTWRPSV